MCMVWICTNGWMKPIVPSILVSAHQTLMVRSHSHRENIFLIGHEEAHNMLIDTHLVGRQSYFEQWCCRILFIIIFCLIQLMIHTVITWPIMSTFTINDIFILTSLTKSWSIVYSALVILVLIQMHLKYYDSTCLHHLPDCYHPQGDNKSSSDLP